MKTERLGPMARAWGWRRVNGFLLELTFGLSWLLVGLAWLTQGEDIAARSPIGHFVPVAAAIWSTAYVVAAVLILVGVLLRRDLLIALGLAAQAGGLLMSGVAAAAYTLEPRVGVYFVQAAACATRILWIAKRGLPS